MFPDLNSLLIYLLLAAVGFLIAEVLRQNSRLKRLLIGKTAQDLEEAIMTLVKGMENLDERSGQIEEYIVDLDSRVRGSLQRVHTLRFNPFKDQGSNQSFATCLLDAHGNGVIISSLYSRDKVSVYAKPIKNYGSEYELSAEEQEAITKAKP